MQVINAQTIINTVNAAALVAPEYVDSFIVEAMGSNCIPWGFDGAIEAAETGDFHALSTAMNIGRELRERAKCELRDIINAPLKIKIQTSARGYMVLENTRARLEKFAATVRSKAAAFGGGLVKAPRAPAVKTWPAGIVKLIAETLQEKQYADAVRLAEDRAGALFYTGNKGPFMLYAPAMVAGLADDFRSARDEAGRYVVFGVASGCAIGGHYVTRKDAERHALQAIETAGPDKTAAALDKAGACNQLAARAEWMKAHDIDDETADHAARIAQDAAQDVAQVLADASAAAAIARAMETAPACTAPAECSAPRELETVACDDTQHAAAGAPGAVLTSAPARAPVTLHNGRVVTCTRARNGSQDAAMQDGRPMSAAEWDEFCTIIRTPGNDARSAAPGAPGPDDSPSGPAAAAPRLTWPEFEGETLRILADLLDCTYSDADAIAMPHADAMRLHWHGGAAPADMARMLDVMSRPADPGPAPGPGAPAGTAAPHLAHTPHELAPGAPFDGLAAPCAPPVGKFGIDAPLWANSGCDSMAFCCTFLGTIDTMNSPTDTITGAELQTLREACGLSREDLAGLARVQARTVKHWESGRAGVPADVTALIVRLDESIAAAATQAIRALADQGVFDSPWEGDIVLIRYASDEDLARYRPDMAGMPSGAHGAIIGRVRTSLLYSHDSDAVPVRIVWMRPDLYEPWRMANGLADSETARAQWAAGQIPAQALPHRADQPPQ